MKVTVIRSKRKTVSIRVNSDLSVTVRGPKRITQREVERILREKEAWIQKHLKQIAEMNAAYDAQEIEYLTAEEIRALAKEATDYIPKRVAYFAEAVGVSYGRITIRNQKTRWGSCSNKGNLNFNCLLMLTPPEIIDYVVVHELCHRKEMNHSKAFWYEVEKVLPDYKLRRKWLRDEGSAIMRRRGQ